MSTADPNEPRSKDSSTDASPVESETRVRTPDHALEEPSPQSRETGDSTTGDETKTDVIEVDPDDMSDVPIELRLDVPGFHGPMDLLLKLVRRHEVDIAEIPIAEITRDYLACIRQMESLDLQVGGEWLEMASKLLYIKSKMLLPEPEADDEEEGPDPREELVRRLVAYEKFKKYAEKLDERPQLGRDTFRSDGRLERFRDDDTPPPLEPVEMVDLMDAVRGLLERTDDDSAEPLMYEMTREKLSLRSVILDVAGRLADKPRLRFRRLFDNEISKNRLVTTFFALLEMSRLEMIRLFQSKLGDADSLYVERAVVDIVDVSQSFEFGDDLERAEA